jgi:hypothetical protein
MRMECGETCTPGRMENLRKIPILSVADAVNHWNEFVKAIQWNKWRRNIFDQKLAVSQTNQSDENENFTIFLLVCWKWSKNIVKLLFLSLWLVRIIVLVNVSLHWNKNCRRKTEVRAIFIYPLLKSCTRSIFHVGWRSTDSKISFETW